MDALNAILGEYPDAHYPSYYAEKIKDIHAADVAPVRHGKWEKKRHKIFGSTYDFVCSRCGCDYALAQYVYCPHCGARMDGAE